MPDAQTLVRARNPGSHAVTLQQKVEHLLRPESYPGQPSRVDFIETHMSAVFLTDAYAYKLKKPVRYAFLDFSTLEARRRDALAEIKLNRRLAPGVYVGIVPLAATSHGLALEGRGPAVDWLVKMRRLPHEAMLDHAIAQGTVSTEDIDACMAVLARFYGTCAPASIAEKDYVERFARDIETHRLALCDPDYALDRAAVEEAAARLSAFVATRGSMLEARVAAGRVIEGHGDLRPEHVCFTPRPLFIDCLAFDRELRILDTADEAGYLALECAVAGAPRIADAVLSAYRRHADDAVPDALVLFYQSVRALLRAKISAWHVKDGIVRGERGHWIDRAARYLQFAQDRAAALDADGS